MRRDHPEGVRAAMAAHAFRRFAAAYPAEEADWYTSSNTVVIVEVVGAEALAELAEQAARAPGVLLAAYVEPELGLASIALHGEVRRLTSSLPLALRERSPSGVRSPSCASVQPPERPAPSSPRA